MKRYIRTKEGKVFDLKRFEDKTNPVSKSIGLITLIDKNKICDYQIFKRDIIKESDTIEELCDAVLFVEENEFPVFVNREFKEEKGKKLTECYLNIGGWRTTFPSYHKNHVKGVIYGAIWTEIGLIYVAKMNEKGELELL